MIVLSTCPLHPLPGWCDMVAELRLIRARTGATPCVRWSPLSCDLWDLQSLSLRYGNGHLCESFRLVHILLPVSYTHSVTLYIHLSATSIAWMVWHCGWASAHKSSDGCYPLCALVTFVLQLFGFLQSLSLRYRNALLCESFQACPCSVTSALHS